MQNRLRRTSQPSLFGGAAKNLSTSQGRYTLYAVVICAIIGMVSYKPMAFIVQKLNLAAQPQEAENLAIMIAFGICAILLVVSLLKMRSIISATEGRRLRAFNQSVSHRNGTNNSDG